MLKKFLTITKPGIIFGNLITVMGGFFLASHTKSNFVLFLLTLLGISLVIASGCVFNNYIDRDIDKLMERTKNRPLANGQMSPTVAILYGFILGFCGTLILYYYVNTLTTIIALIGLFVYVVVYSLWFKRSSVNGTLIGSVSGAVPPLIGYCAVSNNIDTGAVILFVMLSIWQMPHSYAIAIYRFNDYKNANIPVLPVRSGVFTTKIYMLVYTILFTIASLGLSIFHYTGIIYLSIVVLLGINWILQASIGFTTHNDRIWARKMFVMSIIIITILSITMALDTANL